MSSNQIATEPGTKSGVGAPPRFAAIPRLSWSRLAQALDSFDSDPRLVALGVAVGAIYAILMAGNWDRQIPGVARLVVAMALAAPTAGVSVVATLAVFREPAGLSPWGFNATVVGVSALAVAGRVAIRALAGRRLTIRPEFIAIAAYVGLTIFDFLDVSLKESHARALFARSELTQMATGLLLIVVIAAGVPVTVRRYLLAAMVPGLLLAAIAAILSLNPAVIGSLPIVGWLPTQDISARGTGFFRNPNYLGEAMAMGLILVVRGRQLRLPGILSTWAVPLGVLIAAAALVSFSRGALLAVVAGALVLVLGRNRRVVAAAVIIGGFVVIVGYQILLATRHLITFGASVDLSAAAQAASDAARLSVYRAGLELVLLHPILGVGYGQFHYVSAAYLGRNSVTFSHDIYLGIAAEQGLPAIAIFLAMLAAIAYALWRSRDAVAVTAAAMLAAFAVGSLFAENLTALQTSCVLWVALGCALAGRGPSGAQDMAAQPGMGRDRGTSEESVRYRAGEPLTEGFRSTAGTSVREPRPGTAGAGSS